MQLAFNQTVRQPHPRYEILDLKTAQQIGEGKADRADKFTMNLSKGNYTISRPEGKGAWRKPMAITAEDGTKKGEIQKCLHTTKKILFINIGYDYTKIEFEGITLAAYEVGMGANQHYWCVYQDDRVLCAMIHKPDMVKNHCDTYTIYIDDEQMCQAVCLLALYLDCTVNPDIGDVTGYGYDREVLLTTQPEVLAKYDPDFIPRIVARDS